MGASASRRPRGSVTSDLKSKWSRLQSARLESGQQQPGANISPRNHPDAHQARYVKPGNPILDLVACALQAGKMLENMSYMDCVGMVGIYSIEWAGLVKLLQLILSLRSGTSGYGSKLNHQGTAGFGPCFPLPGFHLGYRFLTHSQLESGVLHESSNL